MIKVKIGTLVGSQQSGALTRLAQSAMPMNTALRFKDLLKQIQEALNLYDERRVAVCQDFGTLNTVTQNYDIVPEKMAEFQQLSGDLLQEDIDLIGDPFTGQAFLSSQSISPNDLLILDWLFQSETAEIKQMPKPKRKLKAVAAKGAR